MIDACSVSLSRRIFKKDLLEGDVRFRRLLWAAGAISSGFTYVS
ncbi:unnamed protein product [Acidithrix sp. C25]|nr:unnamed protein product [Acidithrix sp. C25]